MKLFEVQADPSSIKEQLIPAVVEWVRNNMSDQSALPPVIMAGMKQFQYSGPLHRVLYVPEHGDGYDMEDGDPEDMSGEDMLLRDVVRKNTQRGLASWSKTEAGMENFKDYHETIEFPHGVEAIYLIHLTASQGVGLEVAQLWQYAKANNLADTQQLQMLERAAQVEEIIAMPPSGVTAKLVETFYDE